MANGAPSGPIHPVRTQLHNYEYFFYTKHHQAGPSKEAQWLLPPKLTPNQEFWVFDNADALELSDGHGNLYGLRQKIAGKNQVLGTRGEQVAKFPLTAANHAWHGYPIWPIAKKRDDEDLRSVPNEVLDKMVEKQMIDSKERRRLRKGDHI
jgi:hypothetical protein